MDKKENRPSSNQKAFLEKFIEKNKLSQQKHNFASLKKKKRPKSDLTSATDVLQALLDGKKLPLSHAYQVWKLRRHWKEIVGDTIYQHSKPLFYIRGTLYIWSENSVWTQEFIFLSEVIKQKINDHIGKPWVRKIRFQLQEEIY